MMQAPANILMVQRGEQSVLDRVYGIIGTDTGVHVPAERQLSR